MAPKVSEQYRTAKREQILRGAREALSVAPINETSTADITAAAEVSEGTLYNLSLIHISEPTRLGIISYALF